jgi:hypothetical protein
MTVKEKCMEILEKALGEEPIPEEDCPSEEVIAIARRFFECGVMTALRLSDEMKIKEDIEKIQRK